MPKSLFNIKSLSLSLFLLAFAPNWAAANPVLNQVVAGDVSVSQTPGSTVVTQQSARGVVDWHQFNVDANEKVHFQQPDGGVTLNRIDPSKGISQINGNLTATGQVILVNGTGIIFGPKSMVNVGGIIASAASGISIDNFMNGRMIFDQVALDAKGKPIPNGKVINRGTINAADHGLVALVGNSVVNDGAIIARLGEVYLASADKFTIGLTNGGLADGLINFAIDAPANQKDAGVTVGSKGSIIADGGVVFLTANAVSKMLDNAINMNGVIQDNTVGEKQGIVVLGEDLNTKTKPNADLKSPKIKINGKISAKGEAPGTDGGAIMIIGQGPIDISGEFSAEGTKNGGGILVLSLEDSLKVKKNSSINVSGGEHAGLILLAAQTENTVESGVKLKGDSLNKGNGGLILIGGNETSVKGAISAKGGSEGGDGGAIVVVGDKSVKLDADVDLSAPKGKEGYLDVGLVDDEQYTS